jgi:deoxyribodipyrimidine photo-lyase
MRTIVWFRGKDLRLEDHAPLRDAIEQGEVVALFVLDPYFFAPERARLVSNRVAFLLESLRELEEAIARRGSRLVVVRGKSVQVVPRLARAWKADRVVGHRWTEPVGRERDRRVSEALDVPFRLFEGETLVDCEKVRTKAGAPFSVFTPFAREHARVRRIGAPLAAPKRLPPLPVASESAPIPSPADLGLVESPGRLRGGARAAHARLRRFLKVLPRYGSDRDRLDRAGTSRLSADLKFGTLSVRSVWRHASRSRAFANELLWREFAYALLRERPWLLERPCRAEWEGFPWRDDEAGWRAWVQGTTGHPIVDAAARQLLAEGFVHNRARMIAASFLVKDLMIDFRRGEEHYMRLLTDGDWANNDLGWQWSTGCGCDAQPYFRVFHPVTQGERFDPSGDYVRRWVPELARVPTKYIHRPWEASGLAPDYPAPIVDHAKARERFLTVAKRHLRSR